MADYLTTIADTYARNIELLSAQRQSVLMRGMRMEMIEGRFHFIDQLGDTEAVEVTSLEQATPNIAVDHFRRRINTRHFAWATRIPTVVDLEHLYSLTSPYAMRGNEAMNRKRDDVIIEAFDATSWTGADGTTAVTFPGNNSIPADIGDGSEGLTVEKVMEAKLMFDLKDIDPSLKRYWVVSPQQIVDLLNDDRLVGREYSDVLRLQQGEVINFHTFEFVKSNRLPLNASTDVRSTFAWVEGGMVLARQVGGYKSRISERNDLMHIQQLFLEEFFGAARIDEDKVLRVYADESPPAS